MLHTYRHTDRHIDRASDKAGPRGAFAPKNMNILRNFVEVLTDTLEKMSQNSIAYSFVSDILCIFFLFLEKNLHILAERMKFFFYVLP